MGEREEGENAFFSELLYLPWAQPRLVKIWIGESSEPYLWKDSGMEGGKGSLSNV